MVVDFVYPKLLKVHLPGKLLASLSPDELDSYMFQSVGHEGVALYAAAMDLPLFQVSTQGQAIARDMVYSVTEGDEVEDLFQLLRQVKVSTRVNTLHFLWAYV